MAALGASAAARARPLTPARLASILVGLAILGLLAYLGGPRLGESLRSLSVAWLVAALAVTVVLTALTAWRWGELTGIFLEGGGAGFWRYYRSFLLGRAAGLVVPYGLGDLAVRPALHRLATGEALSAGIQGAVLARLVDATLLVVFAACALPYLGGMLSAKSFAVGLSGALLIWLVTFLGATGVVAGFLARALERMGRWAERLRRGAALRAWATSAGASLARAGSEPALLRRVGAASVARQLLIGVEFLFLARTLGVDEIGLVEILVGMPLAQLGTVVALTPAGLGFLEGGFWAALHLQGIPAEAAGTFLVGWRIVYTGFILALSAVALLVPASGRDG